MRDIFEEICSGEPSDPIEAARRSMRGQLRRRFYQEANVGEDGESFPILLDGKPVKTPARRFLSVPNRALAQAIAAEWNAQEEFIDPSRMPLTRLAHSIIDGVIEAPEPVAAEVAKYLASDLLFYRASGPEGLVARQARHWDPVLAWAREALGARFILGEGVVFVAQSEQALAAARAAIPTHPWRLGALDSITALTGSALLALALAAGRIGVDEAWTAAHVDEDWNMEQWGRDELALERRASRFTEMQAAVTVLHSAA